MTRPICDMSLCRRKAFRGFRAVNLPNLIPLCRKHEERMQETRKRDLASRGIDPITYNAKATADEIYAWARGNFAEDEAYTSRLNTLSPI